MKYSLNTLIFLFIALILFISCSNPSIQKYDQPATMTGFSSQAAGTDPGLDDYWHQGKAEISHYELSQNRYKDVHPGEVILILVSEHFNATHQIKDNDGKGKNVTEVLKTNLIRRFTTGFYDYQIMTSVFNSPEIRYPHALKINMSVQDWCGHSYMQVNANGNKYKVASHSYFEGEGDQFFEIPYSWSEDELFNQIRLDPERLPLGDVRMIPSTTITRLQHRDFKPVDGNATMTDYQGPDFEGNSLKSYRIDYPEENRFLEIVFRSEKPRIIEGWIESYPSMFDKTVRKTVAKRTSTILDPYWIRNNPSDASMRGELGVK